MPKYYHSGYFAQGRIVAGLVVIIIGVLLLLNNLGMMHLGKIIADYWPILLILSGIRLVLRSKDRPVNNSRVEPDRTIISDAEKSYYSNVFGDLAVALTSLAFRSGRISNVFGDVNVDLRELRINSGEKNLQVSGIFGDIEVAVPKHVPFYLKASIVAGDIEFLGKRFNGIAIEKEYKSPGYDVANDRLNISISHVFGDIKVA